MAFSNYRKETSERSDMSNWAKKILIEKTGLFFDSIEGCNENQYNVVTHLMERVRIGFDNSESSDEDVLQNIIKLEGLDALKRKINFAKSFNCPLTYVLYCNENEHVWVYKITDTNTCKKEAFYESFISFSHWISQIKGWRSSKSFREIEDLPNFDKALRAAGCAWPTNIDCFVSNKDLEPIGIIEFQNANNTSVERHCNNEFLWGKYAKEDYYGHIKYSNDIRRWLSQEILRVQSGLKFFVITWSANSNDYILKEIDKITFPDLPGSKNWDLHNKIQKCLHCLASNHKSEKQVTYARWISGYVSSYNLYYNNSVMEKTYHKPNLYPKDKTFPMIYYKYKHFEKNNKENLPIEFLELLDGNV